MMSVPPRASPWRIIIPFPVVNAHLLAPCCLDNHHRDECGDRTRRAHVADQRREVVELLLHERSRCSAAAGVLSEQHFTTS